MNSAQNSVDRWSEISLSSTGEAQNSVEKIEADSNTKPSPIRLWFHRVRNKYSTLSRRLVLPRNHWPDEVDGELERQYTCWPPTIAIIVFTVVEVSIFAYYVSTQGEKVPKSPLVYDPAKRDEAWRFISYMLIHASYEHIICNVAVQLLFGIPLEMVHKFWRISAIYLCGVLAGSLATSICDPATILVGASGGVYALITAHVASIIMNFKEMDLYPVVQLVFFFGIMAADVAVAVYKRYSDTDDRTAYAAHLAGALAGLLLGVVVLRNLRTLQWEKVVWWICFFTLIVILGAMIVWNLAVPSHFPPLK